MNRYIKNLNKIEFVVTDACTGKCKHCSQGIHKKTGICIDSDVASEVVRKVCKSFDIKTVMTFGGEPLIFPEAVCAIHNAANELHVPKRQLITNGFFSNDFEKIKETVNKLAESGINEILLSVDAFHQETIPLEPVLCFAKSVLYSGIHIKTSPAWLESVNADNQFNLRTREILTEFKKMSVETGTGNVIFPSGNAVVYLKDYFRTDNVPKNIYEESPFDIKTLSISANGDLLGFNIYEK